MPPAASAPSASAIIWHMTEADDRTKPEDEPGDERSDEERSAQEGGSSGSADTPPPAPNRDDDSPLGDTDQHSDSNA
jgi:hypothetical protein